jgi:four helix bundle protein
MDAFPDFDRGRSRGRERPTPLCEQTAESSRMREQEDGTFGFEKLDAYRRSVEFVAAAAGIISELQSGYSSLSDPLRRAALSVPVNIAEGVGRTSVADRRRYYAIARGSAMECAAILDACRVLQAANPVRLATARSLLLRIVQMLSKRCH